jgi:hypothetical protein
MSNKYYVIVEDALITAKNRNRFYAKKYLDNLYVIEDNKHGQTWLQGKNAVEKTLTEANLIIQNRNTMLEEQHNQTLSVDATAPKVQLQDLIVEV